MSHPLQHPPSEAASGTEGDVRIFPSRGVVAADLPAIDALHDRVFGPGALTRAAYRVREGQPAFTPYCRVLYSGAALVSSIRFTAIRIGGEGGALMLGPLTVAPEFANQGHGRRLVNEGLAAAREAGEAIVLLVGDLPYYGRLGFQPAGIGRIQMPGPSDRARLLLVELVPGAAERARGRVAGAA